MTVLLASLVLGACSSDDDNGNNSTNAAYTVTQQSESPGWQIDWSYNQERPDWTTPDGSGYENWTILMVQIEQALQPFATGGDMMALFVNGELRGLASPVISLGSGQASNGLFLLKAYGNETGQEPMNVSLKYYCQQLKHIFTQSADISYSSDESTGIEEDFIPDFILGSAKYPVVKTVNAETLLAKAGITPAAGNQVAAFVGDECRGTATLTATGSTTLVVFCRNAEEQVTLKCYDAAAGKLYTIPNAVSM